MLIYTDKKKIKRKKIKRITIALTTIILIILNTYYFSVKLHSTNQTLINYSTLKPDNSWYINNTPTHIFSSSSNNHIAILIPQNINKTNSLSVAKSFSKTIPNAQYLFLDKQLDNIQYLLDLAHLYNNKIKLSNTPKNIFISNNLDTLQPYINKHKLTPNIVNITTIDAIPNAPHLASLNKQYFPQSSSPTNQLEEEEFALKAFAEEYTPYISSIINSSKNIPFSKKNELLKNISICITSNDNTPACLYNNNQSLIKNITTLKSALPKNKKIKKLYLLTSFNQITPNSTNITLKNTGLYFEFGQRNSILLPNSPDLLDFNQAISTLKTNAQINPTYHNKDMKLYQFRAVEVNLNDNI